MLCRSGGSIPFPGGSDTIGIHFADPDGNGHEVHCGKGRFPGPWNEALGQSAPAGGARVIPA